jgi:tRNA pseudouridine32 synthase / 23S rRNA pseudouridine746 synthase
MRCMTLGAFRSSERAQLVNECSGSPNSPDVIRFDSATDSAALPISFPSPFDRGAVHPLARVAAEQVQRWLLGPEARSWRLDAPGNGKMFGVLIAEAPDGSIGYLRGFSGMVDGQWEIDGWVPAAFDVRARDGVWVDGEADLRAIAVKRTAAVIRDANVISGTEVAFLDAARRSRSRELLPLIQASYQFANARGEMRALRDLFAPAEPPGGAGDCAAPKLLAHAYRLDLRPVALAEFWFGASPPTGDRRSGVFYPACRGKCAPILAHMLDGLLVDPAPLYGAAPIAMHEPALVYEDEHLLVVNKPCGLLSVPGKSALLHDSVVTRLRQRYPDATGPLLLHRLDLDTSGLLLAAKDSATFAAMQRLFAARAITKRYVAWVEGEVRGDSGTISLPLRVDVDDRPRQIHDPEYGKAAETEWFVCERVGGRTRVEFVPRTGRTHQLRVHASHPLGLGTPIVGDRLYGVDAPPEDQRLMLHAESLEFAHPITGAPFRVQRAAPF